MTSIIVTGNTKGVAYLVLTVLDRQAGKIRVELDGKVIAKEVIWKEQ